MTLALPSLENRLAQASTPEETRQVEIEAQLAKVWAKEHQDYHMQIAATKLHILSRRKTTALIAPHIRPGPKGRNMGTFSNLEDFSMTKSEWNRREQEAKLTDEQVDEYFDDVMGSGKYASIYGMLKYFSAKDDVYKATPCFCPKCGKGH